MSAVTIIDYGMCNLLNVARAFEHCGATVTLTENPDDIPIAQKLVVPGVGAFRDSIEEVRRRGFAQPIIDFAASGRPLFGICVGMQMLFDSSDEFGEHAGLGILAGRVHAIPSTTTSGQPQRIPHIGWNHLVRSEIERSWNGTVMEPFSLEHPAVYFVHSFAAEPESNSDRLADCLYGGHRICAAVQRGNLIATQFHPERSGETGLRLIRRFLGT